MSVVLCVFGRCVYLVVLFMCLYCTWQVCFTIITHLFSCLHRYKKITVLIYLIDCVQLVSSFETVYLQTVFKGQFEMLGLCA